MISMSMHEPIVIVGGGAMGNALARRWRANLPAATPIYIVEPDAERAAQFRRDGFSTCPQVSALPQLRGLVVLAIKPQLFHSEHATLQTHLATRANVLISIMAGVKLADLQSICPRATRVMPNTPAAIGEGVNVVYGPKLDTGLRNVLTRLMEKLGQVVWVEDEALIHVATAISGSGPAYVYAFMEALASEGEALGLPPKTARLLAVQTTVGAGLLARESSASLATLRENVTSKAGTTEAALAALDAGGFSSAVRTAIAAARARSIALAGD